MIVRDDQIGSLNFTTPKLILVEVTPSPVARASSTNVVGMVGQSIRGKQNKIYSIGSMPEFERKAGGYVEGYDAYLYAKDFFDANGSTLKFVRAMSSGAVASTGIVYDETSGTIPVMLFTADSEGTWGDSIIVDVTASTVTGYVDIQVRNSATQEVRRYAKVTTDSTDSRYILDLVNKDASKFFTLTMYLTDGTLPEVASTTLSGGSNGATTGNSLPDTAYVGTESGGTRTGIQLFKSQQADDVSIVVSARNTATINTGLINHVNDIKLSPRRTIITFAEGTSVDTAVANMASLDNDKVKVVFPNVYVSNIFTGVEEIHNPTAFDSANDTVLGYWQSASQTQYPVTVLNTEIDLSPTDVDTLTAKRINPIVLKIGRGFIRASDYTTSSNPSLSQNVVRKAKDFFARTFYDALQFYISKPITPKLWQAIKDTLNGILKNEATAEHIGRSNGGIPYGVKCDSDNNPQEIVQLNKVIVLVEISLLAPADIIQVFLDAQQDKTIVSA